MPQRPQSQNTSHNFTMMLRMEARFETMENEYSDMFMDRCRRDPPPPVPSNFANEFMVATGCPIREFAEHRGISVEAAKLTPEYLAARDRYSAKLRAHNEWKARNRDLINLKYDLVRMRIRIEEERNRLHARRVVSLLLGEMIDELSDDEVFRRLTFVYEKEEAKRKFVGVDRPSTGDEEECCICCENQAQVQGPRCGHLMGCFACCNRAEIQNCPLCRAPLY